LFLVITSDSRGSANGSFAKAAPGQIVEVGIAEQT
jgi:transketolase C-terminal domain/subunit